MLVMAHVLSLQSIDSLVTVSIIVALTVAVIVSPVLGVGFEKAMVGLTCILLVLMKNVNCPFPCLVANSCAPGCVEKLFWYMLAAFAFISSPLHANGTMGILQFLVHGDEPQVTWIFGIVPPDAFMIH